MATLEDRVTALERSMATKDDIAGLRELIGTMATKADLMEQVGKMATKAEHERKLDELKQAFEELNAESEERERLRNIGGSP